MMQPTPAPSSPPKFPVEDTPSYPAPPQNIGTSAPFAVLVGLFEKLQNERRLDRRKKFMSAWFNHWKEEVGYDLYPVLRLILPQKDRERAVYGLKEKNLAKTYIKLIPLGMRDPDAIRLLNWKKPTEHDKTSGDFPTVLYEVVSKRSSVIEGSLSIEELNDILDELSKNMGKQDIQSKIMQRVYNRTTPEEQRWIVRIILKDLVISVKETTVFQVFHPDAQDLYNTCSDLKKVAWTLWDASYRLNANDKTVRLFHAFAPMLCKRPTKTIEHTVKEMGGAEFFLEEKLDGERMQLHKRGNEYFYCSRKGKDYTYLYGKHVGTGSLTPFIDKAFDERVNDIILDGEMLVWDPISERNLPFGTLKTAALDKSKKEHNPRPCFKIFDLLYLNGESLLHKSTAFRKKNMRACLTEVKGRVEFVTDYRGKTSKDIRSRMDEVMAARGEGLVIKHPSSKYVLNGRNMDWIKVKPEYMENMGETLDVLVVAGNYGSGSRGGGVSTLICAVLDDRHVDDDDEPKYSTFVRIGSGLSYADYAWVRDKPWKVRDPKNPPEWLQEAKKSHEDKGDVYLEPHESFVLKVKAAEIVSSDQYHIGCTMRFPRALAIRDDLSVAECATVSEVLDSLRSEKKRQMEDNTGVSQKKRKTTAKKASILPDYKGPKLNGVQVKSNIFEGLKFVVMADPKSRTGDEDKKNLVKMIHANGGGCVQIAANHPELFVVYGGSITPYDLKLVIDKGVYDVVKPEWLRDSIALGRKAPLRKKYFFHATDSRTATDEYQEEDDETDQPWHDLGPSPSQQGDMNPQSTRSQTAESMKEEEIDPLLADWLNIDKSKTVTADNAGKMSESETENDSDNADVAIEEHDVDEGDLDDWFLVKGDAPLASGASMQIESVKMGEDDAAMEYDQNLIFRHLCFYLDSPSNAHQHGMSVKTKNEEVINQSFSQLKDLITENGGRVVDLNEPKLTHVVIDKRDAGRRLELMKRTSKPKRRHLIISEYIQACVDEATLLDEEDFVP